MLQNDFFEAAESGALNNEFVLFELDAFVLVVSFVLFAAFGLVVTAVLAAAVAAVVAAVIAEVVAVVVTAVVAVVVAPNVGLKELNGKLPKPDGNRLGTNGVLFGWVAGGNRFTANGVLVGWMACRKSNLVDAVSFRFARESS